MSALLSAFGIDWRLLLINLVNFGLLSGVLWYFLYTPLTNMLESRRKTIIDGVANAHEADRRLREIESTRAGLLAEAGKESDEVLANARSLAAAKQRELIAAGEASAQTLLTEAEHQATELKREAIEQSKKEVAKLIVLGMERMALEKK